MAAKAALAEPDLCKSGVQGSRRVESSASEQPHPRRPPSGVPLGGREGPFSRNLQTERHLGRRQRVTS
jgi:hypothetical protein